MRLEHRLAYVMGIALPLLEVLRRQDNFFPITSYVDDVLIGCLLLTAAIAETRGQRVGPVLLVVAWAILCGGFYYSFFGQLETGGLQDVSGAPKLLAISVKGVLYGLSIAALVQAALGVVRRTDPMKNSSIDFRTDRS